VRKRKPLADTPADDPSYPSRAPALVRPHDATATAPSGFTRTEIALIVIAAVATITAMKVAEPFLVPLVTGILLSYTLRPLVSMLQRAHIPRFPAAVLVVSVLVALVAATIYVARDDLNDWVGELPAAARKLRHAVADSARQSPGPMTHMKAAAAELDKAAAEASGKPVPPPAAPVGVQAQFQEFLTVQSGKALSVLAEISVAMLLALFLLAAGDTFRRKVAKIAGASLARRRVTVEVLDEIDGQIQVYMMTLLLTNVLIALSTWAALFALGLADAGMWGAMIGIVHIIPYVGTIVATLAVGVAMFVQTGSLGDGLIAGSVVLAIASTIGMGLASWMQGRATHINPVAVLVGVLFFGWLWGGWGLLLSVPILAVVKSIADRIEALHPISELLRS
jgi:predicted PurR-regulated permease PerM